MTLIFPLYEVFSEQTQTIESVMDPNQSCYRPILHLVAFFVEKFEVLAFMDHLTIQLAGVTAYYLP